MSAAQRVDELAATFGAEEFRPCWSKRRLCAFIGCVEVLGVDGHVGLLEE